MQKQIILYTTLVASVFALIFFAKGKEGFATIAKLITSSTAIVVTGTENNSTVTTTQIDNPNFKLRFLSSSTTMSELIALGADVNHLSYPLQGDHGTPDGYYITDGKSVFWIWPKVRELKDANPRNLASYPNSSNLMVVSDNKLYLTGVLQDVDLKTLKGIGDGHQHGYHTSSFYTDASRVYYLKMVNQRSDYLMTLSPVSSANPRAFVTLNDQYGVLGKDDANIYATDEKLSGLDVNTFSAIPNCTERCLYFSDKNGLYTLASPRTTTGAYSLLRFSADQNPSFILLGDEHTQYLKTDSHVYYGTTTITGADPATFKPIHSYVRTGGSDNDGPLISPYAKDLESVYYKSRITGADPQTFQLLPPSSINKDKSLYPSALQYEYGKDAEYVYYKGDIIDGANPLTFHLITSGSWIYEYGADDQHAFFHSRLITGANPKNLKTLGRQQPYEGCADDHYSTDGIHVFFESDLVPNADAKTFESHFHFGNDAKNLYKGTTTSPTPLKDECNYG